MDDLLTALVFQSYRQTLIALLRLCAGLKKKDIALRCGVTAAMVTYWLTCQAPMALVHELTLRQLLVEAIGEKRQALAYMDTSTLAHLQCGLVKAFMGLSPVWGMADMPFSLVLGDVVSSVHRLLHAAQMIYAVECENQAPLDAAQHIGRVDGHAKSL